MEFWRDPKRFPKSKLRFKINPPKITGVHRTLSSPKYLLKPWKIALVFSPGNLNEKLEILETIKSHNKPTPLLKSQETELSFSYTTISIFEVVVVRQRYY